MPLVSVILPTYNRKETLLRAVKSVVNQTFTDLELIIVDDGSTDGSEHVIEELEKEIAKPSVRRIALKENRGVSFARNQGILHSDSKYLAFLDSDDEWAPEKLAIQIPLFSQDPQALGLVHANEIWVHNGVRKSGGKKHRKGGGDQFLRSVEICCISPSATVVPRSILQSLGLFREDFPVCEDYELWLRITKQYPVGFCEQPLLTKYGGHSDQLSHQWHSMDYWRVRALVPFLEDRTLKKEWREFVKQTMITKCEWLLQGYKKHNNFLHEEEVQGWLNACL